MGDRINRDIILYKMKSDGYTYVNLAKYFNLSIKTVRNIYYDMKQYNIDFENDKLYKEIVINSSNENEKVAVRVYKALFREKITNYTQLENYWSDIKKGKMRNAGKKCIEYLQTVFPELDGR